LVQEETQTNETRRPGAMKSENANDRGRRKGLKH